MKLFLLYQCYQSSLDQCYHVSRFIRRGHVPDLYTHRVNRRLKLACDAFVVERVESDGADDSRTATNALIVVVTVLPGK